MIGDVNSELYTSWSTEKDGEKKAAYLSGLLPRLKRHASAVVYNRLRARNEEIVSKALWQAIREDNGFRGESKFSTWFHKVVVNLCTDYLRDTLSRNEGSITQDYSDGGNLAESVVGKIEVKEVLASLKEEEARIVEMRMAGYSDEEIGEVLGVGGREIQRKRTGLQEKVRKML